MLIAPNFLHLPLFEGFDRCFDFLCCYRTDLLNLFSVSFWGLCLLLFSFIFISSEMSWLVKTVAHFDHNHIVHQSSIYVLMWAVATYCKSSKGRSHEAYIRNTFRTILHIYFELQSQTRFDNRQHLYGLCVETSILLEDL